MITDPIRRGVGVRSNPTPLGVVTGRFEGPRGPPAPACASIHADGEARTLPFRLRAVPSADLPRLLILSIQLNNHEMAFRRRSRGRRRTGRRPISRSRRNRRRRSRRIGSYRVSRGGVRL